MWILFAFGSALFAGLTSILAKCGIRKTDSDTATAIRTIVVLLFSWLMVAIVGLRADHHRPEREDVGLSNPLGPRDRRVVAVLFPRAAARAT